MYRFANAVILLFCKAPIPGQVKTRLTPHLSEQEAAELHCELALKTLQVATQTQLCEVQLWCSPTTEHDFFEAISHEFGLKKYLQQGADLGERMHHAFLTALATYRHAIIIGCDCPSLLPEDIELALTYLHDGNDCVLAPAEDGGYVLLGLNQPQPELFANMPWSTDIVCKMTLAKTQDINLSSKTIGMQWDLDTIDDLNRYRQIKKLRNDA